MLTLVLIVILLWVVLTVLLSAWTLWFQAYVYTEATSGIIWRGPAAGSAITVVFLLWIFLDYRAPGHFRPLFDASSTDAGTQFDKLLIPTERGGEEEYRLIKGAREYRLRGLATGKALPTRPKRVIVIEDGQRYVFEPERDEKGNFKARSAGTSWFGSAPTDELRYIDGKGRVMLESSLGQISTFRGGRFVGNLLLNIVLLAALFAAIWLLLRFAWPQALLQAFVTWVVMQLFILPPVLTRVEDVAKQKAQEQKASS